LKCQIWHQNDRKKQTSSNLQKYYQLLHIDPVASQTIRKFQDQGYQTIESQGMINNEFQGIKITSMSMQSFKDLEGLASECQTKSWFCSRFVFDLMKTCRSDLSKYQFDNV
jgi:hypothetical protein